MSVSKNQCLDVQSTEKNSLRQLSSQSPPRPPVLANPHLGWNKIQLQHHIQPAWETAEHYKTQHAIAISLCQEIELNRLLDDRRQIERAEIDHIAITPANVLTQVSWNRDDEYIIILLDPDYFAQIASEVANAERLELLPWFAQFDPLISQIGRSLKSELETNGWCDRLYVESATNLFIAHLLRHHCDRQHTIQESTGGLSNRQLQILTDYINTYLDRNLSVSELAALVQISPYHFTRLFKQSTGKTPHQYLTTCRLETAKSLLANRNLTIDWIAIRTGFNSHSHFTRAFRQHLSITPKTYRDSL